MHQQHTRLRGPRTRPASQIYGTLYLFHFEEPIGNRDNPRAQAQHYSGFAEGDDRDLLMRIAEHEAGEGAKIMRAVVERGVPHRLYVLARDVPKTAEVALKRKLKNNRDRCPVCSGRHAELLPIDNLPDLSADFDGELADGWDGGYEAAYRERVRLARRQGAPMTGLDDEV
jgi:hypothetical protein